MNAVTPAAAELLADQFTPIRRGADLPLPGQQDEAALIQVCRQFAEAEITAWYRYVVEPNDALADELHPKPDLQTVRWITATPATTLEGLRAEALAVTAWDSDAYAGQQEYDSEGPEMLASLLRDLAKRERADILERLAETYGPLPSTYTTDFVFKGAAA